MKKIRLSYILIALLVVAVIGVGSLKMGGTKEVSDLKMFVDRAASLVEQEGSAAFAEFRDKNGQWIKGDRYIFVYDMTGKTLVLPLQPAVEGTDRYTVADPNGERYVETMVDVLNLKKYGWNTYVYVRPETGKPTEKLSYFKRAVYQGQEYIVGSGIYLEN
jgi:hypothetical protein